VTNSSKKETHLLVSDFCKLSPVDPQLKGLWYSQRLSPLKERSKYVKENGVRAGLLEQRKQRSTMLEEVPQKLVDRGKDKGSEGGTQSHQGSWPKERVASSPASIKMGPMG
jgi:hypothetical protein